MKISITGADGYVGNAIYQKLKKQNFEVNRIVRKSKIKSKDLFQIGDFTKFANLSNILSQTDVLIHCAGISNVKKKFEHLYDKVNFEVTKNIAEQASVNRVKRLIFISTIKVCGEKCDIDDPFDSESVCKPTSKYGISKLKSENVLLDISKSTDLEIVIIRCPVIYGNNHSGNIELISKLIKLKIPLPFKNIRNKRSIISIDNLVNFIALCSNYKVTKKAKNQIFSISDKTAISTSDFIKKISFLVNNKVILFKFPKIILKIFFLLLLKKNLYNSLFDSLYFDCDKAKVLLNWEPNDLSDS